MSHNIYDSVRPLHLLLKASGLVFFSIDSKTFEVSFTFVDALLVIFHLFLVILLNFVYWNIQFVVNLHGSAIIRTYFPYLAYLNFIVFTVTKFWTFSQRHKFGEFFGIIQQVDVEFKKFDYQFDYLKRRRTIVILLLVSTFHEIVSMILLYFTQKFYNIEMDFKVAIFTCYGLYINFAIVAQFITTVCAVKERYTAMKDVLR